MSFTYNQEEYWAEFNQQKWEHEKVPNRYLHIIVIDHLRIKHGLKAEHPPVNNPNYKPSQPPRYTENMVYNSRNLDNTNLLEKRKGAFIRNAQEVAFGSGGI